MNKITLYSVLLTFCIHSHIIVNASSAQSSSSSSSSSSAGMMNNHVMAPGGPRAASAATTAHTQSSSSAAAAAAAGKFSKEDAAAKVAQTIANTPALAAALNQGLHKEEQPNYGMSTTACPSISSEGSDSVQADVSNEDLIDKLEKEIQQEYRQNEENTARQKYPFSPRTEAKITKMHKKQMEQHNIKTKLEEKNQNDQKLDRERKLNQHISPLTPKMGGHLHEFPAGSSINQYKQINLAYHIRSPHSYNYYIHPSESIFRILEFACNNTGKYYSGIFFLEQGLFGASWSKLFSNPNKKTIAQLNTTRVLVDLTSKVYTDKEVQDLAKQFSSSSSKKEEECIIQ